MDCISCVAMTLNELSIRVAANVAIDLPYIFASYSCYMVLLYRSINVDLHPTCARFVALSKRLREVLTGAAQFGYSSAAA